MYRRWLSPPAAAAGMAGKILSWVIYYTVVVAADAVATAIIYVIGRPNQTISTLF